ncbi:MAG TPA: TolC family protein [Xanthomonadales bacterium]|nr:TolC family protein [Xanthomonadales bacterium]
MRFRYCGPLVAVLLASCASAPPPRGDDEFTRHGVALATSAADREAALADASKRLAQPLAVDDAIAIALARSPDVAVRLAELDLEYAELIEAGEVSNPSLEIAVLDSSEPDARKQINVSLMQGIADLFLLRSRTALARGEFSVAQGEAVREIQELIGDVAEDYYELLGAEHVARMREVVAHGALAAEKMAESLHEAGNLPALERDMHRAEAVDARLEADEAAADATQARHALARRLGLAVDEPFVLADALALPVAAEDEPDALLSRARDARLDLAGARKRAEVLAQSYGVTRRFRWLGDVEIGFEYEREPDGARLRGPAVALELPIFHRNRAAVARAEARVDLAEARALGLERAIGHEVRAAADAVRAARGRVELHRERLVPLRERIVARTQEQVNFMLAGVFELIEAKHDEYDAYQGYLEALRDYWIARTQLATAIGAALPSAAGAGTEAAGAIELPEAARPAAHEGHHDHHDGHQP